MSDQKPKLAEYLEPDTSDMRVNRVWAKVSTAQRSRHTRRWVALGASLAAMVAAVVTWWLVRPAPPRAGTEWTASSALVVTLPDATMELTPASTARLESIGEGVTRLRLHSGRALFDVVHREHRRFEVLAGERVVRVVGTRFVVTRAQSDVSVEVERGVVEVDTPAGVVRLQAGERWPSITAEVTPPVHAEAPVDELPPAEAVTPSQPKKKHVVAPVRSVKPTPQPAEPIAEPAPPTAAEVFARAIDARRAGNAAEAVAAFERFLGAFPADPRAPLANFEIGRLKMDRLNDPAGAAVALKRALSSPAVEFREEATSRLVRALHAVGRLEECRQVKAEYLARWPAGSYVQSVTGRCQEP